ncbi:MAG: DNA translocase FtsK [Anaerolineae bacterium]|nr:DNA translocase FtsK [Anaerolineae bacterium]
MPPWLREVTAVLLIVVGLVSLLVILDLMPTWGTPIAESWRDSMRQAFGMPGAWIVALAVVLLGLLLLAPAVGLSLSVRWQRILMLEVTFAAFLALAHLVTPGARTPRLLAEEGLGGGYVGYALSEAVSMALGPVSSFLVWSAVFVAGLGLTFGLRMRDVRAGLRWLNATARRAAERIDPDSRPPEAEPEKPAPEPKLEEPHVRLRSPGPPGERESIVPRGLSALTRRARRRRQRFDLESHSDTRKVRRRGDRLPPLDLLEGEELYRPSDKEIKENAKIIHETLADFDIEVEVIGVKVGPTVTQYAVQPFIEREDATGHPYLDRVRVSKIASLSGDLALALSARRLRIQAPVPGTNYVGVEVPNRKPSAVRLRPILETETFYNVNAPLALPLGRDVSGAPVVTNLAAMPHLLIAGTTGSGKSVAISSMITALVMNNTPDDLNLILLDPKMVELARFNGLPHLLGPVETDPERVIGVLRWATHEMDRRYRVLEEERARNLETFNKKLGADRADERLPYIVLFIDEIGDLMLSMPEETEETLCRLAQMARAVGIHVVMATQRPSTDIITGVIKANFPARISFAVASSIDSRVILDYNGAESLLGNGDMLFLPPDAAGPRRVQGCIVSDPEVERVVAAWAEQYQALIDAGEAEPPGMAPLGARPHAAPNPGRD